MQMCEVLLSSGCLLPRHPLYNAPAQVVEAKNVPKMDYFTSTSPYVQVSTHKRGAKQVGRHCQQVSS